MSDCSNHKKDVAGISDMKVLAEIISELHYKTLKDLLFNLSDKLYQDGVKDRQGGRKKLGNTLCAAANSIEATAIKIKEAYQISKPFMQEQK